MCHSKLNPIVLLALGITGALVLAGLAPREAATSSPFPTPLLAESLQDKNVAPTPKTDFFGDALPPGVVARMGTERLRHASAIKRVLYLPSGKLVSAGDDATVRVWDAESGKELLRLPAGEVWTYDLAASNDGKLIAAAGDAIYIWDAATGKKLHQLHKKEPQKLVFSLALTPDGTRLVSGHGDYVYRLWDVVSGKQLMSFSAGSAFFPKTTITPNGKTIATTHYDDKLGNVIRFWDANTGEQIFKPLACDKRLDSLAFSPDGRTIVAGDESGKIRFWELATGQVRLLLNGHKRQAISLAFSPDGTNLASAGGDHSVRIWDFLSGKEIRRIRLGDVEMDASVWTAAYSPDGSTLATGTNFSRIRLWDAATGKEKEPLAGHESHVIALAYSVDGKQVISGCGSVQAWEAATGKHLRTYPGSVGQHIYSLALSPDGQTLAAGSYSSTFVWNTATGEEVAQVKGAAYKVALLATRKLVASNYGGKLWDLDTLKPVSDVPDFMLAASPDGGVLYQKENELFIRDPIAKQDRINFKVPISEPPKIANPGNQVLKIVLNVHASAFTTDGKILATASVASISNGGEGFGLIGQFFEANIHFWDVATGRLVRAISQPVPHDGRNGLIKCLAFSPDGRTLAAGGRAIGNQRIPPAVVLFWDVKSGKEVHQILVPPIIVGVNVVGALAFSPDGKTLATGGSDTTVLVWELPEAISKQAKVP